MRRNTLLVTLGTSLVASACVEKGEPFGPTPAIDHRFAAASVAAVPTRYAVQLDGQPSFAQAINQSGTAVGANSSGNAGGFLAGESIGGLTPGYGNAIAFGINDAGAIVGTDALLGPWISTAFGPATPLSAPSGAGSGLGNARAISNGGVIVGDWPAARTGKLKPVVWDAQGSATMYNDVDPVDDCDAAARNISPNSAYVAGWSEVGCLSGGQSTHAVRWANGTPTDLGPGTANDVTDGGIVVGVGFATRHAMVWDGGTAIDIHPATFCTESIGMAVVQSLAGDVLAAGMCTVGIQTLGVVWSRNAGWAPIALLDAFSAVAHDAYPYDINSSGVLVGLAGDHSGGREYAAVWDLGNHPPTVSLAGPIVGTEGVMLQLSATVADPDGDALVVDWDFGDGSPHGAGASVGHAYAAPGTYTVTVTATDPLGLSGRTSTTANIAPAGGINVPPVADAGGPYVGAEGAAIAFDGSKSYDPDNSPLGITFEWDFGDGTAPSSSIAPAHTYQDNGTYTVTLRVADFHDTTATTVQVSVGNVAPSGVLVAPTSAVQGTPFTLSLTSISDPSPIDLTSLTLAFDCATGAFGPTQSAPSFSCTNVDVGSLPVRIRVVDKDGGASTYSQAFQVTNAAPAVRILGARRVTIPVGGTLTITGGFADAGTNDAPWQASIAWGAGEGTTSLGAVAPRTALTSSHTFGRPGRFEVWLSVVDRYGASGRNAISVVVQ